MLLQSDVARLVLGYLAEEHCPLAYQSFANESTHLKGMCNLTSQGFPDLSPMTVFGKTLHIILNEYYTMKDAETRYTKFKNKTRGTEQKFLRMWDKLEDAMMGVKAYHIASILDGYKNAKSHCQSCNSLMSQNGTVLTQSTPTNLTFYDKPNICRNILPNTDQAAVSQDTNVTATQTHNISSENLITSNDLHRRKKKQSVPKRLSDIRRKDNPEMASDDPQNLLLQNITGTETMAVVGATIMSQMKKYAQQEKPADAQHVQSSDFDIDADVTIHNKESIAQLTLESLLQSDLTTNDLEFGKQLEDLLGIHSPTTNDINADAPINQKPVEKIPEDPKVFLLGNPIVVKFPEVSPPIIDDISQLAVNTGEAVVDDQVVEVDDMCEGSDKLEESDSDSLPCFNGNELLATSDDHKSTRDNKLQKSVTDNTDITDLDKTLPISLENTYCDDNADINNVETERPKNEVASTASVNVAMNSEVRNTDATPSKSTALDSQPPLQGTSAEITHRYPLVHRDLTPSTPVKSNDLTPSMLDSSPSKSTRSRTKLGKSKAANFNKKKTPKIKIVRRKSRERKKKSTSTSSLGKTKLTGSVVVDSMIKTPEKVQTKPCSVVLTSHSMKNAFKQEVQQTAVMPLNNDFSPDGKSDTSTSSSPKDVLTAVSLCRTISSERSPRKLTVRYGLRSTIDITEKEFHKKGIHSIGGSTLNLTSQQGGQQSHSSILDVEKTNEGNIVSQEETVRTEHVTFPHKVPPVPFRKRKNAIMDDLLVGSSASVTKVYHDHPNEVPSNDLAEMNRVSYSARTVDEPMKTGNTKTAQLDLSDETYDCASKRAVVSNDADINYLREPKMSAPENKKTDKGEPVGKCDGLNVKLKGKFSCPKSGILVVSKDQNLGMDSILQQLVQQVKQANNEEDSQNTPTQKSSPNTSATLTVPAIPNDDAGTTGSVTKESESQILPKLSTEPQITSSSDKDNTAHHATAQNFTSLSNTVQTTVCDQAYTTQQYVQLPMITESITSIDLMTDVPFQTIAPHLSTVVTPSISVLNNEVIHSEPQHHSKYMGNDIFENLCKKEVTGESLTTLLNETSLTQMMNAVEGLNQANEINSTPHNTDTCNQRFRTISPSTGIFSVFDKEESEGVSEAAVISEAADAATIIQPTETQLATQNLRMWLNSSNDDEVAFTSQRIDPVSRNFITPKTRGTACANKKPRYRKLLPKANSASGVSGAYIAPLVASKQVTVKHDVPEGAVRRPLVLQYIQPKHVTCTSTTDLPSPVLSVYNKGKKTLPMAAEDSSILCRQINNNEAGVSTAEVATPVTFTSKKSTNILIAPKPANTTMPVSAASVVLNSAKSSAKLLSQRPATSLRKSRTKKKPVKRTTKSTDVQSLLKQTKATAFAEKESPENVTFQNNPKPQSASQSAVKKLSLTKTVSKNSPSPTSNNLVEMDASTAKQLTVPTSAEKVLQKTTPPVSVQSPSDPLATILTAAGVFASTTPTPPIYTSPRKNPSAVKSPKPTTAKQKLMISPVADKQNSNLKENESHADSSEELSLRIMTSDEDKASPVVPERFNRKRKACDNIDPTSKKKLYLDKIQQMTESDLAAILNKIHGRKGDPTAVSRKKHKKHSKKKKAKSEPETLEIRSVATEKSETDNDQSSGVKSSPTSKPCRDLVSTHASDSTTTVDTKSNTVENPKPTSVKSSGADVISTGAAHKKVRKEKKNKKATSSSTNKKEKKRGHKKELLRNNSVELTASLTEQRKLATKRRISLTSVPIPQSKLGNSPMHLRTPSPVFVRRDSPNTIALVAESLVELSRSQGLHPEQETVNIPVSHLMESKGSVEQPNPSFSQILNTMTNKNPVKPDKASLRENQTSVKEQFKPVAHKDAVPSSSPCDNISKSDAKQISKGHRKHKKSSKHKSKNTRMSLENLDISKFLSTIHYD